MCYWVSKGIVENVEIYSGCLSFYTDDFNVTVSNPSKSWKCLITKKSLFSSSSLLLNDPINSSCSAVSSRVKTTTNKEIQVFILALAFGLFIYWVNVDSKLQSLHPLV